MGSIRELFCTAASTSTSCLSVFCYIVAACNLNPFSLLHVSYTVSFDQFSLRGISMLFMLLLLWPPCCIIDLNESLHLLDLIQGKRDLLSDFRSVRQSQRLRFSLFKFVRYCTKGTLGTTLASWLFCSFSWVFLFVHPQK